MSAGVGGGGSITTEHHSRLYFLNSPTAPLTARDPFFIKPEYLSYESPMHHALYSGNRGLLEYNNYTSSAAAAAAVASSVATSVSVSGSVSGSGSAGTAASASVSAANTGGSASGTAVLSLENNFAQQGNPHQQQQQQQGNPHQEVLQQQHPLHHHLSAGVVVEAGQLGGVPGLANLGVPHLSAQQSVTQQGQSSRAQKAARRRSNESIEARERRLERNAARMRDKRSKESEAEYRVRLAKNAEANRVRRQNETEVQRTLRLMKNAARQRLRRASETVDERKKRLAKAAERMRIARASAPKVIKPPLADRLKGY
ncbi:AF4/FMR2 family member lilli [Drosophila teissieri]|uniref:AF4/FMR2 family member lilli n=1 Tax=Drosophila teissieri TaxID=7243 RepID=UPI001CBA00D7|nr:AF4/FMR2 family member lilli [Drosophila teissieri]